MSRVMLVIAAVLTALVIGSFLYWQAEGSSGTPEDFRLRVAATGLEVSWANVGPRGGAGVVRRSCGPVEVSVNEIDDALWVTVGDGRRRLSAAAVGSIETCPGG